MKFRALWILVSTLAVAFSAFAQIGTPGPAGQIGDDITYTMPQGWIAQPVQGAGPEMKAHYAFFYQGTPCGEMSLYCGPLTGSSSIEQAFQDGLANIRPALPYYQARGTQKITIGGMPTMVHEFSYTPAGGGILFIARTYTMIAGSGIYTFWFQTVQNYFRIK